MSHLEGLTQSKCVEEKIWISKKLGEALGKKSQEMFNLVGLYCLPLKEPSGGISRQLSH